MESKFNNVVVVRSITRASGATFIAENIAYQIASQQKRVLLIDLNLWNCDLTNRFGIKPNDSLSFLASQFFNGKNIGFNEISKRIQSVHSKLKISLLPGKENWISCQYLQGADVWVFVESLFTTLSPEFDLIIIDIGSHEKESSQEAKEFLPGSTIHQAVTKTTKKVINVFGLMDHFENWYSLKYCFLKGTLENEIFLINFQNESFLFPKLKGNKFLDGLIYIPKITDDEQRGTMLLEEIIQISRKNKHMKKIIASFEHIEALL
jgi:hypothetical protein